MLQGHSMDNGSGWVPAHLRGIGFVPQDGALFPHFTVAGNIGFGLKGSKRDKQLRIDALMDMVALDRRLACTVAPRTFWRATATRGVGPGTLPAAEIDVAG